MRVKRGFASRRRHKRLLKLSEGFKGRRRNDFKQAKRGVQKAMLHAYKHRRMKKREYRVIWTMRINAAARESGLSYSRLIHGLKLANIEMDRKVLAEIAVNNPADFKVIAEKAIAALA